MQFPSAKILIFAKAPIAGLAKTRLIPALGAQGAAQLYAKLLQSTVEKMADDRLCPIECWCAPDCSHELFLSFEQQFDLTLHRQQKGDLGERMAQATRQALLASEYVVLIGGDVPDLTPQYLKQALNGLSEGADAVLGPAEDGGYVLLAIRQYEPLLFSDIPWSSDQVLAITRERLKQLGWNWLELQLLWDVDRPEDLLRLGSI